MTIHSTQSQVLREALKAIRERADLSQRELSAALGREHSLINKVVIFGVRAKTPTNNQGQTTFSAAVRLLSSEKHGRSPIVR